MPVRHGRWHTPEQARDHDESTGDRDMTWMVVVLLGLITIVLAWWGWRG